MILRFIRSPGTLYGALTVALFWRVFFLGETLVATDLAETNPIWGSRTEVANDFATDTIEYYYPNEVLYSKAVRRGEIPLWNEAIHCGKPIPHGTHLYASVWPVKLLFLTLFDPDRSYNYYAIFHFWLAAVALCYLSRELGCGGFASLAAGLAYALCGRSMTWLHVHYLMPTVAYAPLVFLFVLRGRRSGLWREFAFASIPLAGLGFTNPHAALATSAALLLFAPRRGWVAIGLAALLTAVVALPLFEFLRAGTRDPAGETAGFYWGRWRCWLLLLTLFDPAAFGPPTSSAGAQTQWIGLPPHEYAVYLGLLPITLILLHLRHARRPEERRFLILAATVLAVATLWPLPTLLMSAVPFLFVSIPTRFLFLFSLSGCVLFACALERLRRLPTVWKAAAVVLLLIDLVPSFVRFNRTHSAEPLRRVPRAIAYLQSHPGRVAHDLRGMYPPLALWGVPSAQGYENSTLRNYSDIVRDFGAVIGGRKIVVLDFGSPALDRLAVRHAIVEAGRPMPLHWRRVYNAEVDIYENLRAQPIARMENGLVDGDQVESPAGGRVEIAEMNYPGWEARIDGERVPIAGPFLSAAVPPGRHKVTFEFSPRSVRIGAWISMAGVLALVLVGFADRLRRRV